LKRKITEQEEQILRACHHDFGSMTQQEASQHLNIPQQTISDVLKRLEKIVPQFFPILTKLEAKCYHCWMIEGWEIPEIAEYTGQSENAVYKTLQRTRDKGMCFTESKGRVLSYDPSMDADVKRKF